MLLVLDDFHAVTDPLVLRFTQVLLENLPGHAHVLIGGRSLSALNLSRLKLANEAAVIGPEELRFTGDESRSYLARRSIPFPAETTAVFER
ncbi:MAG: helix-turn-helix transcriptional regulator [Bacteroidota bacterium]